MRTYQVRAYFRFLGFLLKTILFIVSLPFKLIAWAIRRGKPTKKQISLANNSDAFYRSRAWRQLRLKAFARYGRKCACCGARNTELHVDHIKPRSKFPKLALDIRNLQILCRDCNLGKSNVLEADFRGRDSDINLKAI